MYEKMFSLIKQLANFLLPALSHRIRLHRFKNRILPSQFRNHMKTLTNQSIVIDLGANIGMVSECLALTGANVKAFEPNAKAFSKLNQLTKKYKNLEVFNNAAGIKNDTVKLYLHKNTNLDGNDFSQASSLNADKPNLSSDLFEEIQEIDFAEYLKKLDHPVEMLKIDIEGYEIELINHLLDQNALDKVSMLYVETHERKFTALKEVTQSLKKRIDDAGLTHKFYYDWH